MNENLVLAAQLFVCAGINLWMLVALYDNLRYPGLNAPGVAMVMRFDLMAQEYPDEFRLVRHRRVENPKIIRLVYFLLVGAETVAAITLSFGTACLALALFGAADPGFARSAALIGALAFTLTWSGFLVGGNYFVYWYCHFQSQATHFLLALWGLALLILLLLPA